MNVALNTVLLFILLDCVTNEKPPCAAKGCHIPLTAFYRPVKALLSKCNFLTGVIFADVVVVFAHQGNVKTPVKLYG